MAKVGLDITKEMWVIADTHFGHDNLVKYCNRPITHNETMIHNWHSLVGNNDIILHLGDLMFGRKAENFAEIISGLPGEKFLIKGNHDRRSNKWYVKHGFTIVLQPIFWWSGCERILFSHRPEIERKDWTINIHGHIHNNGYGIEVPEDKDYRNVSVEVVEYRPVKLIEIIEGDMYQGRLNTKLTHGSFKGC